MTVEVGTSLPVGFASCKKCSELRTWLPSVSTDFQCQLNVRESVVEAGTACSFLWSVVYGPNAAAPITLLAPTTALRHNSERAPTSRFDVIYSQTIVGKENTNDCTLLGHYILLTHSLNVHCSVPMPKHPSDTGPSD